MLEVEDKFKLIFNDLNECSASYDPIDSTNGIEDNVYTLLHSVMDLIFVAKDIAEECNAADDLYELKFYSGQICMFICSFDELIKNDFILLCFYKSMSITLCNVILHITNILKKNDYDAEVITRGFCSFSEYMGKLFDDKISEITSNGKNIYDYSMNVKESLQSLCELTSLQIKAGNKLYSTINSYLLFSYLLKIDNRCADEQLCKLKGTIDDDLGVLFIFSEEQNDFNRKPDYKVIHTLVNDLLVHCKDEELRNCLRILKHNISCLIDI